MIKGEERISEISKFFEESRILSIDDVIKYFLDFTVYKSSWRFTKYVDKKYKDHFLNLMEKLNEDEKRVYIYFFQHLISIKKNGIYSYQFAMVKNNLKLFQDIYIYSEN